MQFVRESIFVSAIRAFFNALLAMIGVLIGFMILMGIAMSFGSSATMGDTDLQMEILPDAKGSKKLLPETTPVILQIDIQDVIGGDSLQGDHVTKMLRTSQGGLLKKDRVKAILININSPGGAVLDSDVIYREIMRYKKEFKVPVYAYTSGICASGGYYIACSADKILASPVAMVGSVGVLFGPNFNFWQFMQTHGIDAITLTKGLDKVKFPMFSKLPEKEKPYDDLISIIGEMYDRFVSIVTDAREPAGLSREKLINTFGARIYFAQTAKVNGYVDEANLSYEDALGELAKSSGVDQDDYQVVRFDIRRSVVHDLFTSHANLSLRKVRQTLLGQPSLGKWDNQPLYYYNAEALL